MPSHILAILPDSSAKWMDKLVKWMDQMVKPAWIGCTKIEYYVRSARGTDNSLQWQLQVDTDKRLNQSSGEMLRHLARGFLAGWNAKEPSDLS